LAREPTADDVDAADAIVSKSVSRKSLNIVIDRHLWPMLRQHALTEWVYFAKRHGLKPARPL
jgi:hypothetical protein